ncbi:MAG: molybdate ABC transporter substrate-binding protein [Pseudomonadota bacterium]
MKRRSLGVSFFCSLFLAAFLIAFVSDCPATSAGRVTIFAAASTTNAINDIAAAFKKQTDIEVTPSFASSSTLAKQIDQGAPASVYISADEDWMNFLDKKNLIDSSSRRDLLGNRLVIIAPASSKLTKIDNVKSEIIGALGAGKITTGDPDHVPVGKYTKAAMQKLGVWNDLEPKMARAGDVRGALALVERGEAELGVVYSTDAAIGKNIKIIGAFPLASYPKVVYPVALIKSNVSPDAKKFFEFLNGPEAKAIFEKYGFSVK